MLEKACKGKCIIMCQQWYVSYILAYSEDLFYVN